MPETYGPYAVSEALAASGPWAAARATDGAGQTVRLTTLRLPATMSSEDRTQLAGAVQRSIESRTAAPANGGVALLAAGEEGDVLYVAEAMPDGVPLRAAVQASGPMASEQVVPFMHSLGAALEPVHAAGLAHGWLTPDNVYLDGANVRVAGQIWSSILTGVQSMAPGAEWPDPAFAAPEIRSGVTPDNHAEVFSAAALAAFAATGCPPEPASLNSLPEALASALARGLSPQPEARYRGVREMTVDVTVEQALGLSDTADQTAVPTGGDVPDWARELLHQTESRRDAGQPLVEIANAPAPQNTAAPAPPPAQPTAMTRPAASAPPPPPRIEPEAPRKTPARETTARETTARETTARETTAREMPAQEAPTRRRAERPAGSPAPVFNWNEGSDKKSSFVPLLIGIVAILFLIAGLAITILHAHH